ncbi:MAG: carbohydrate binding domain-containing protein [Porcipelethomonas sp.]
MIKKLKSALSVLIGGAVLAGALPVIPAADVSAASVCEIDVNTEYQTIDGFGGMNHPEWTGKDLTDEQRQKVFGNGDDELGFSVLRVFVNPDSSQWYKAVPTAKFAREQGVKVFASPWEPPAELAESGGSNGKLHIPESNYAAYAEHLNDFGSYMKSQGVDLYAISVQNEPDYASEWTYWSTDETTNFLANYADKITSTRVMSPESFQYAPQNASWVPDGGKKYYTKILNNAKAFANCDLFGTHFYGTQRAWMDFPELESCGKPIWMTEVYTDSKNDADVWPMALDVSENIHNGLVVGNMSAYVWWYIRRSYGPLKEDGTISKRGYCMAQYSKFVRPGDVRIEATEQPADNVYISAYKNDNNQVTVVAVNKGTEGYAQQFSLGGNITNVDRYRTSASENLAKTLGLETSENTFWAQLPAESVSTFVVTLSEKAIEPDENGYYFHDTFEGDTFSWEGHGSSEVLLSGRSPYKGGEALLVQNREKSWNGAQKALNSAFRAGQDYSFSVCAEYLDGSNTQNMALTLQYTDSNGDTKYSRIASATAVKGNYVQLANTNFRLPEDGKDFMIYIETESGTDNFYIDEAIGAVAGTKIEGPDPINFNPGDINCDGVINCFDMVLAKRGLIDGFSDNVSVLAADADQNGEYNSADAVLIRQFILGIIKEFPVSAATPE